jgi:hypothetical protein
MLSNSGFRQLTARCVVPVLLAALAGCVPAPPPANSVKSQPRIDPRDGITLEKPLNVSFSTYSPDWPVDWQWIDPEDKRPTPKDVKKGVLRIRVPTGKNLIGDNLTAPRYVKPIKGDFQIETQVVFLPKENYQGAGLLIYVDGGRFLRFERAFGGNGGGGEGLRLDVRSGGEYKSLATPDEIPTTLGQVDLKIVRTGGKFTAYWRESEGAEWQKAGDYESDFPQTVFAGLVASNTARDVTAEFNYIRLAPVGSDQSAIR